MIHARNSGNLLRIMTGTLLCLLLAGCGLKGDLYLPEPEQPAPASTAGEPVPGPANESAIEPDSDKEKKSAGQPEAAPGQP